MMTAAASRLMFALKDSEVNPFKIDLRLKLLQMSALWFLLRKLAYDIDF